MLTSFHFCKSADKTETSVHYKSIFMSKCDKLKYFYTLRFNAYLTWRFFYFSKKNYNFIVYITFWCRLLVRELWIVSFPLTSYYDDNKIKIIKFGLSQIIDVAWQLWDLHIESSYEFKEIDNFGIFWYGFLNLLTFVMKMLYSFSPLVTWMKLLNALDKIEKSKKN